MYGGVELNGADKRYSFANGEILGDGIDQVLCVDADGDEDI